MIATLETSAALRISTPMGDMFAVSSEDGIVSLEFGDGSSGARPPLCDDEHPHLSLLARELAEYFAGTRREFSVPLAPIGTDFQLRAWEYLCTIPYAQTRSYGQQAAAIGRPSAVRAVGRANGTNLIAIIVPCHRVIGSTGALTGYASRLDRKQWLLDHERRYV